MKFKKISMLYFLLVTVLTLPGMAAVVESIYGHVSFVEDQATVVRAELAEQKAVVNLPLVPGDTIVTSSGGRCELQFDNGTVIRLDKNSSLRITTVNAPTLTSKWNITTLHLLHGQMYTLPQTYNQEMFQIITPNAAVNLKNRTAATIRFDSDLGTTLFCDAGKFEVMYGDAGTMHQKLKVKAGQAYVIDAANNLSASNEKRSLEFVAWNEYVDRHFKELHYGVNKVPPKLEFGSSALRYWVEHWSSLYGEWIYDELFGYVWKPAAEQFAQFDRPFFHADYVRVNGRLFLIPQEIWGWVPAHMGTWVWMKRGWTWIPGSWFHSGVIDFFVRNGCFFPDFNYYFWYTFGGFDLYNYYRDYGRGAWSENYYRKFHKHYKKPPLKNLPRELRQIIKRINKAPLAVVSERLNAGRSLFELQAKKMLLPAVSPKADFSEKVSNRDENHSGEKVSSKSPVANPDVHIKGNAVSEKDLLYSTELDWNPDGAWAKKNGLSVNYSSSKNAVVCPKLNISSDQGRFFDHPGRNELAGYVSGANASHTQSSSSTQTISGSQSVSDGAKTGGNQSDSGQKEGKKQNR